METTDNALNWFEISVNDIVRAKKFYDQIFGIEMAQRDLMGMTMAFFPADDSTGKVSGVLVQSEMLTASSTGSLIYLKGFIRQPQFGISLF